MEVSASSDGASLCSVIVDLLLLCSHDVVGYVSCVVCRVGDVEVEVWTWYEAAELSSVCDLVMSFFVSKCVWEESALDAVVSDWCRMLVGFWILGYRVFGIFCHCVDVGVLANVSLGGSYDGLFCYYCFWCWFCSG